MKVTCLDREITGFTKRLEVEVEGEVFIVDLVYDSNWSYDITFRDKEGVAIEMPEWADKYDNGQRSLDHDLDEASGIWEFCPAIPSEREVAV
jgi:hypothetical protein